MDCLQTNVDALLTKIKRKYKEYGIQEKPFVVVKADNGTYGMGIMTVRDVKDLDEINRKTRNKMSVIKDGQSLNEVIIQEGVITHERLNDAVAEPVVYMMDRYVVGGFYRIPCASVNFMHFPLIICMCVLYLYWRKHNWLEKKAYVDE